MKNFPGWFFNSNDKKLSRPYNSYIQLLLAKMTTKAHEEARSAFGKLIIGKLGLIGNLLLGLHMLGQAKKTSDGME